MTQPNPVNYELAAAKIADGTWHVDAEAGLVRGSRGAAFRRTNSWGYVQIKFRDLDDWRLEHAALAHRIVWESVHGPLAPTLTINHLNGDKRDNRIVNLEAVTLGDNIRHGFATGLTPRTQPKTHCMRGHEFTEANTTLLTRGERRCKACQRIRRDAYHQRRHDSDAHAVRIPATE